MKEWEANIESRQLSAFNELIDFLTKRCQMLEAMARRSLSMTTNSNSHQAGSVKITTSHAALTNTKYTHCKSDHQIYQYKAFKELSIAERLKRMRFMKLYLNCLKGKHMARDCSSSL